MQTYDKYVIVAHISPDGDALGSSLGLFHYLLEQNKDVRIIVPNGFPDYFRWMPMINHIVQHDFHPEIVQKAIEEADVICCLDFNALNRCGHIGDFIKESGNKAKRILMDHHPSPDNDFDLACSHPEMCATAEVVFRFLTELDSLESLSRNSAICLYTGMMTDTGGFTYNSSRAEIFEIISKLLTKGFDKDSIYRKIYYNNSVNRMRLMGHTLNQKMKIYPEFHTVLITLTQEELKEYGYKKGDTEGFVNLPLEIKDIFFSCFLREDKTMIKVSLRSVGNFSCTDFAKEIYNGGGHRNASGGEFYNSMEDAIQCFEKGLEQFREQLESRK
ncbi:MAG: DHH family phosphoesterase [Bacteroidaceae bacterium]|nr:DHH family phosphoesterase [Bacteroidaceae bacterium]MBP9637325.1 DHH family phosphoesterase [Bacteroidaceae bacterium]